MQNPVKIPAYTDKEITVNPPTTKSATGTVTFSDTYSNVEVNIPHNLNKKLKSFVMLPSTVNHAVTYSSFAYPYFFSDTETNIIALKSGTSNFSYINFTDDGKNFKFTLMELYSQIKGGTYRWYANA